MQLRLMILLVLVGLLSGCASSPGRDWQPADPESLEEWQVEGRLTVRNGSVRERFAYLYRSTAVRSELRLFPDSVVQMPLLVLTLDGDVLQARVSGQDVMTGEAARQRMVAVLGADFPLARLGYWLRALPASAHVRITKGSFSQVEEMEEYGWTVRFDDRQREGQYQLPGEVRLRRNDDRLAFSIRRAETGFLTHWCGRPPMPDGMDDHGADQSPDSDYAVAPRWLDHEAFCSQLARVHGGVVDPRAGLFGPDSMMWEINRPLVPPAMGAGRALLLQISHPWVTAGIDQHSEVRNDPMERARRTFSDMYAMVFGSLPTALATANKVHRIHSEITGTMPYKAGDFERHSQYAANEVNAMIWVQATLWDTLVRMYEQTERKLSAAEKEQFYQESKLFAMLFGIPMESLPDDWEAFQAYCRDMWGSDQLAVTDASRNLAATLFRRRNPLFFVLMPIQENITANNLPDRLRDEYGFSDSWLSRTSYRFWRFSGVMADRLTPGFMHNNPVYQEAMARMEGEKTGFYARRMLKFGIRQDSLVN